MNFWDTRTSRPSARCCSPPAWPPIRAFAKTLADPRQPNLTPERLVCLLFSSICIVHGSYGTHARTLVPASVAHDSCSGYTAILRSAVSSYYRKYIVPSTPLPRLGGVSEKPLQRAGFVKLLVKLGKTAFRIPFVFAERSALPLVLCTASADGHVRVHQVQVRTLELVKGGSVPVARTLLNRT